VTTRIEFHFNAPDKLAYACRLLRKAVGSGARVVVLADSDAMAQLDSQLWTFAPLEFVPHARRDSAPEVLAASPVLLTDTLAGPLPHQDVLVHLGQTEVRGFEAFSRLIEVVSLDEADRQAARRRWKHYTEQGHVLLRHDLQFKETTA
jgi:DNA polymerase-3 subunit chi